MPDAFQNAGRAGRIGDIDGQPQFFQLPHGFLPVAVGGGQNQIRPERDNLFYGRICKTADFRLGLDGRRPVAKSGDPDDFIFQAQRVKRLRNSGGEGNNPLRRRDKPDKTAGFVRRGAGKRSCHTRDRKKTREQKNQENISCKIIRIHKTRCRKMIFPPPDIRTLSF